MLLGLLNPCNARADDPLAAARAFCAADGKGARLSPSTWSDVAPFVTWDLEPAWDHITLIHGYEINTPRRSGERVTVDVTYSIAAQITAGNVARKQGKETLTLELVAGEDGVWRLGGTPPAPHVFENFADANALADLLGSENDRYTSNASYVWNQVRADDAGLSYVSVAEFPSAPGFTEVASAEAGDVALYYSRAGQPYHIAWIESEETVLSATLNSGLQRSRFSAFPGTVRYWRRDEIAKDGPGVSPTPRPSPRRRR